MQDYFSRKWSIKPSLWQRNLKKSALNQKSPTHLKDAAIAAKNLCGGQFADIVPVVCSLLPATFNLHGVCFIVALLAQRCACSVSVLIVQRLIALENPFATLRGQPFSFQDAVHGSYLHIVGNQQNDLITEAGRIILRVLPGPSDIARCLLVIAFMRSSRFARWIARRVWRDMTRSGVLDLIGRFKEEENPHPAHRFLPDNFFSRRFNAKQACNTDLQGYTLSAVVDSAATFLYSLALPQTFGEASLRELLSKTRFRRGMNLMLPPLAGFFTEWKMWRGICS